MIFMILFKNNTKTFLKFIVLQFKWVILTFNNLNIHVRDFNVITPVKTSNDKYGSKSNDATYKQRNRLNNHIFKL
jgi:hypothetical protein